MKLKDIVAISGEPGLFRFVAQGKNAIVVENLETGKRTSVYGSAKVSSLEDISVFTDKEDLPLGRVFDMIQEKENGGPAINPQAGADELKRYFGDVIPEYSRDKVYLSDIKKIVKWYNILHERELLVKDDPEPLPEDGVDIAPGTEKESDPVPGVKE
jgi:hypothetical protein